MNRFVKLALIALIFSPLLAFAAEGPATVTWTEVTTNEDGSAITDLHGYYLYNRMPGETDFTRALDSAGSDVFIPAGTTSFQYTQTFPDGTETTVEYALTAIDTSGNESILSNSASKTFDQLPPAAPVISVTVSVNVIIDGQPVIEVAQNWEGH